jgi:hypothetical protein
MDCKGDLWSYMLFLFRLNLDELFNLVKDEFYDEIKNKSEENQ